MVISVPSLFFNLTQHFLAPHVGTVKEQGMGINAARQRKKTSDLFPSKAEKGIQLHVVSSNSAGHGIIRPFFIFQSHLLIVCPTCRHSEGAGDRNHCSVPTQNLLVEHLFKAEIAIKMHIW